MTRRSAAERSDLIAGIKPVSRAGLPKLFDGFDQIWHR
jgi:hypothetical protein